MHYQATAFQQQDCANRSTPSGDAAGSIMSFDGALTAFRMRFERHECGT
jgi:hypothetical protein